MRAQVALVPVRAGEWTDARAEWHRLVPALQSHRDWEPQGTLKEHAVMTSGGKRAFALPRNAPSIVQFNPLPVDRRVLAWRPANYAYGHH